MRWFLTIALRLRALHFYSERFFDSKLSTPAMDCVEESLRVKVQRPQAECNGGERKPSLTITACAGSGPGLAAYFICFYLFLFQSYIHMYIDRRPRRPTRDKRKPNPVPVVVMLPFGLSLFSFSPFDAQTKETNRK
jgi:hypothetical protein